MTTKTHRLVGAVIQSVQIATDQKALRFLTDRGEVIARTDGDCCSQSWVEHVSLPALGFPATVLSVVPLETSSEEEGYDVVVTYGLRIETDRGDLVIDYRNASNGYYGGWLSWPDDSFYGGVYGQNDSTCEWSEIGEDR